MSNPQPPVGKRWVRDYVFDILRDLEIEYIFGVPGTNEIPIIDGCSVPGNNVTYIECLHENIAIGAAMGYARMSGKPGVLVVHVTPGIGHSLGNLFNAWRSHVPLVILCCQQHNELVTQEPLLASNTVEVAKQYTKWSHELRSWEETPLVLQRAFKEALAPPTGPVFISLPWEFTIHEIADEDRVKGVTRISPRFTGDPDAVRQAATALQNAKNPVIIGGDAVGYADAWPELQQLAELIGAPVLLETFSSMANFPNRDYHWQGELPGSQQALRQTLQEHDVAFLCGFGAQAQLAVFKYTDGPLIPAHITQVYLTNNTWDLGKNHYGDVAVLGDIKATLPEINALIAQDPPPGAPERNATLKDLDAQRRVAWNGYIAQAKEQKDIWAVVIADALSELIRENNLEKRFVYVHEAVSDPAPFQYLLPFDAEYGAPTSYYCVEGGSLGWSMPATLGIKLQQRGYQGIETDLVVNAVGDGSSLFYPQVYWTATHRKLPILYLITNNREYHTLQLGLQQVIQAYGSAPGYGWQPQTTDPEYLRIQRPDLDFVALARAFGIASGQVVNSPAEVKQALKAGIEHVLGRKEAYIIDFRTCQDTPAPPPTAGAPAPLPARYALQPPLDIFHHRAGVKAANGLPESQPLPVIF
jgi:benzoylformate decarboxylase